MLKVLSIAGSDPSSGAGIQVDLKTFHTLRIFGMAIPTALTIQNSKGVSGTHAIRPNILSQQIDSLLSDIRPDAVKIGMVLTRQNVEAVASVLGKHSIKNLVIDPVVRSTRRILPM